MRTRHVTALAMLAGFALGAVAVQSLHAQAKPPVYQIVEIDVHNPEAYAKGYIPIVRPAVIAAGGRFLAEGRVTPFEGEPPKSGVIVQQWDSIEKLQAWRHSTAFEESRKIGEKYAKFRAFAVEGESP